MAAGTPGYSKPLPKLRGEEHIYFNRAAEQELVYQECRRCGTHISYPRVVCPHCFAAELDVVPSTGTGTVHSFTTLYRPGAAAFRADVPYTIVLVDLDEGVRVLADLVTSDHEAVQVGMPVSVVFDRVSDDFTLPRFVPVTEEDPDAQ